MRRVIVWIVATLSVTAALQLWHGKNVAWTLAVMWTPGLLAIVFALFERAPLRQTLNLGPARKRTWLIAAAHPLVVGACTVGLGLATGLLHPTPGVTIPLVGAVFTLLIHLVLALGEELGWRGYFLTKTRHLRHGPLLIGVVWAVWHFPGMVAGGRANALTIPVFTIAVILISYFLSWLVEVGANVLVCGWFHGVWNFLRMKVLFGSPPNDGLFSSTAPELTEMEGVFGLLAVVLVSVFVLRAWYGRRRDAARPACEQTASPAA
jgi:membrane protease YdiL (CAAX protease family)